MRGLGWLLALVLLPGMAEAQEFVDRAVLAKREGKLEEASRLLREGLREAPDNAMAHYTYAWVLVAQNKRGDARQEFELALDLGLEGSPAQQATRAIERLKRPAKPATAAPRPASKPLASRIMGNANYVYKQGSRYYHLLGCRWMLMTPLSRWRPALSEGWAEAHGLQAHLECLPWKRTEEELVGVEVAAVTPGGMGGAGGLSLPGARGGMMGPPGGMIGSGGMSMPGGLSMPGGMVGPPGGMMGSGGMSMPGGGVPGGLMPGMGGPRPSMGGAPGGSSVLPSGPQSV